MILKFLIISKNQYLLEKIIQEAEDAEQIEVEEEVLTEALTEAMTEVEAEEQIEVQTEAEELLKE